MKSEIERVKLDLLSLVSHELRTPLTSVLNALRMLKEEELSVPDRGRMLDMALRNAEKLNSTLGQLLDLSRLVSDRLVCRFSEVSMKHLVTSQLDRFLEEADANRLQVQVNGSVENFPVLLADGPRLEKVLASLFENAQRFSPPSSKIVLKLKTGVKQSALPQGLMIAKPVRADVQYVLIELTNSIVPGSVSPDDDVFGIFSQQEGILDRMHEGVGGSLAIGFEVLKQHSGALHAKATHDQFSVWLALPILENEQALLKVLESRLYALRTEVGALSLMVLEVEPRLLKQIHEALKSALFRASDTVYSLADTSQIAVLMDDCKKADAPKIVKRLLSSLGAEATRLLDGAKVGLSCCPEDATDPEQLLSTARRHLEPIK